MWENMGTYICGALENCLNLLGNQQIYTIRKKGDTRSKLALPRTVAMSKLSWSLEVDEDVLRLLVLQIRDRSKQKTFVYENDILMYKLFQI